MLRRYPKPEQGGTASGARLSSCVAILLFALATTCGGADDAARAASSSQGSSAPPSTREAPPLKGRVIDEADLFDQSFESALDGKLADLEGQTTDQLIILTTRSLNGEAIERYARRIGNAWGVGQAELDNGVLLVVAPNERKVRIEVGRGLEGLLTNPRAKRIIEEMILPEVRAGEFEEGVEKGTDALIEALQADQRRPQPRPSQ